MDTRDDYQFVLLPWEHRGARFDARPDFVATAHVGGTERLFLLKAKRNILFFKQAGRGDEFLCALETPLTRSVLTEDELRVWLSQNAEFVQMWWRAEIAQEKYTRVFLDYDIHPNLMGWGLCS